MVSSFYAKTRHPATKEWETAFWMDNHFGRWHYGVKFPDGRIYDPEKVKLPTTEMVEPPSPEKSG